MNTTNTRFTVIVLAMLVTGAIGTYAATQQGDLAQETGPVYNVEGAWYGIVTIEGLGPVPSLDTFTSNAEKHGIEGSALCTIPAVGAAGGRRPNPLNPNGWLSTTPSAHGNWARIATNKYAYTMVRTIFDENGRLFGWAKFWGTTRAALNVS